MAFLVEFTLSKQAQDCLLLLSSPAQLDYSSIFCGTTGHIFVLWFSRLDHHNPYSVFHQVWEKRRGGKMQMVRGQTSKLPPP